MAFAEWTCEGKVGACKGTFTLTGGTGKYAGVTGSSEMIVRWIINALITGWVVVIPYAPRAALYFSQADL